jgi:3-phenylpropionate/trans-cinnamate dioxygenase ferredoxin reductase subunit
VNGTVIVGAGQAGLQAAMSLRQLGYGAPITMVGEEAHLPYQRPPLSKGFVTGKILLEGLWLQRAAFYSDQDISLVLSDAVVSACTDRKVVSTASGRNLHYDHLILATGAAARTFPGPGGDSSSVVVVRTLEDAQRLVERLAGVERMVVVGGGFVGLEVAALACSVGIVVSLVESADRLMGRAVSEQISSFAIEAHRRRGVDIRLGVGVRQICADGTGVILDSDELLEADLVVVGVGGAPRIDLARELGAETERGVLVDRWARTSIPEVFAIGDCAQHRDLKGLSVTLESVQNAIDQGKVAAQVVAFGKGEPYDAVPWFWSDQGDLKFQILGLATDFDQVVLRGDVREESFTLLYLQGRRLVRAESVNRPADLIACRQAIGSGQPVNAAIAADAGLPLRRMLED